MREAWAEQSQKETPTGKRANNTGRWLKAQFGSDDGNGHMFGKFKAGLRLAMR
jgi:hypothetical protein